MLEEQAIMENIFFLIKIQMPMHKQNIDAVWPLGKENFS